MFATAAPRAMFGVPTEEDGWFLINPLEDVQTRGYHLNLDVGDFDDVHNDTANNKSVGVPSEWRRSNSIPIPFNGLKRTLSEEQVRAEEKMADFRDYVMFHRIVNGIAKQQQDTIGYYPRRVNDMCLANIIGARNLTEKELNDIAKRSSSSSSPSSTLISSPLSAKHKIRSERRANLLALLQETYDDVQPDDPILEDGISTEGHGDLNYDDAIFDLEL